MKEHMNIMKEFFDEWENKIKWDMFDVSLNEKQERMMKRCFDER